MERGVGGWGFLQRRRLTALEEVQMGQENEWTQIRSWLWGNKYPLTGGPWADPGRGPCQPHQVEKKVCDPFFTAFVPYH